MQSFSSVLASSAALFCLLAVVGASSITAPPLVSSAGATAFPEKLRSLGIEHSKLKSLRGGEEKIRVGILTAGGLAPCLSAAIGYLIEGYTLYDPSIEIICYVDGYKGLLKGDYLVMGEEERKMAPILTQRGGSPIGNSRVKLTNVKDCVKRGLTKEGENPQKVAADQLVKDGVSILHTVGGDDTNTAAADLAKFLAGNDYDLTVVGLPKTIDNDVYPIKLSLGAWTAANQGATFFRNVVNEHSANPRMLIIHEVMGRHCGWLTASTAKCYRDQLKSQNFLPGVGLRMERLDVHGIYIPELSIDVKEESARLKKVMDEIGNVNIFLSEGAGVNDIIKEMEAQGKEVPRDAFGHPKLDAINPGKWFGEQFAAEIGAEKVMVQKSGYFARAAAPNDQDRALIRDCAHKAVESAILGLPGVVGHDEETDNLELRACEFERIAGGKPFNVREGWFMQMLAEIGQDEDPEQQDTFQKRSSKANAPVRETSEQDINKKLEALATDANAEKLKRLQVRLASQFIK